MEATAGGLAPLLFAGLSLAVFWRLASAAMIGGQWRFAMDVTPASLVFGFLSILLLVLIFGAYPLFALYFVIAIIVHEYGHVVAYRLAGHAAPRFRLLPFGGVAVSEQPIKTEAESAFISLMGPGFSLVLLVLTLAAHSYFFGAGMQLFARDALFLAMIVSGLNLVNMFPFYPLDGGRTLKSILTVFGASPAETALLGLNITLGVAALAFGRPILLILAIIGLLGLAAERRVRRRPAPMAPGDALWVLAAYLVIAAPYAALLYFTWPIVMGLFRP